jgi:hypothetical protein
MKTVAYINRRVAVDRICYIEAGGTVHISRVDPRKEREACGNARSREQTIVTIQRENIYLKETNEQDCYNAYN